MQVFALEDIVAAKHRADKVLRIQYASGAESSVPRFFLECYVRCGFVFTFIHFWGLFCCPGCGCNDTTRR